MITELNKNGTYTAFQRLEGSKKVGVICEAETIGEAMYGAYEQVVKLKGFAGIPDHDNPYKSDQEEVA